MLAANYQSFSLAFYRRDHHTRGPCGFPPDAAGTGSTLNLESYMGIIMSVGVSVSNAILVVTNAEEIRKTGAGSAKPPFRQPPSGFVPS